MELTNWQPEPEEDEDQITELEEAPDESEIDAMFRAWEERRI